MKKALAALLASFVGLFGYQIVDKAIEERVNNLEYQVSSQQEEIESLHLLGKYESGAEFFPSVPNSTNPTSASFNIGDTQKYTGQTKFLFRKYINGAIIYISPSDSDKINDIKIYEVSKINTKSHNQPQAEIAVDKEDTPKSAETPDIAPPSTAAPSSEAPSTPDSQRKYTNDYYVYITDASRTILSIDDYYTKTYDENYCIINNKIGYKYFLRYNIKGQTDKELAGKEFIFYTPEGPSFSTTIRKDGTFNVDTVISQVLLYKSFNNLMIEEFYDFKSLK